MFHHVENGWVREISVPQFDYLLLFFKSPNGSKYVFFSKICGKKKKRKLLEFIKIIILYSMAIHKYNFDFHNHLISWSIKPNVYWPQALAISRKFVDSSVSEHYLRLLLLHVKPTWIFHMQSKASKLLYMF